MFKTQYIQQFEAQVWRLFEYEMQIFNWSWRLSEQSEFRQNANKKAKIHSNNSLGWASNCWIYD